MNDGLLAQAPPEVWVIDTSSLIAAKSAGQKKHLPDILRALTKFVDAGTLVFPAEVHKELKYYHKAEVADPVFDWVDANRRQATRFGTDYPTLAKVLQRASKVLDPEKTSGPEEADAYVLALALKLKEAGSEVTVITQESRDKPFRLSMSSAAGLLKIYAVSIFPFLEDRGIFTRAG